MGDLHRIDPPDTIDTAIRLLAGLQSDGWALTHLDTRIDYQSPGHKQHHIPVETEIVITLRPAR